MLQKIPGECGICASWPSRAVCQACSKQFAQEIPRCATCALAVPAGVRQCGYCLTHPSPFLACAAAVDYAYPWSELIQVCKFGGNPQLARCMAEIMAGQASIKMLIHNCEVMLPVPLFPSRLAHRGFNLAMELTFFLKACGATAEPRALRRVRETSPQAKLPRRERLRNVHHAFAIHEDFIDAFQGKRILLIDDVMTTGSSLQACAEALQPCTPHSISALVFARTASH